MGDTTVAALLLATGFVVAAVYEWLAVTRVRRWPTITAIVWSMPWPARVAVVVAGAAAWTDHLVTGWVL